MAITKQKFQKLGSKLLSKFSDLASPAVIVSSTGIDYETQTRTTKSQTVDVIRVDFLEAQVDGRNIKSGDYMIKGSFQDLEFVPSPDNTEITFKSELLSLKKLRVDAADSVFTATVSRK